MYCFYFSAYAHSEWIGILLRFYLNGKPVTASHLPADITLLAYLRTQANLLGTKEGCASGDCGACTVLLGEHRHGRWVYKSANTCILLLAQLAGKSVITVEGLAGLGSLHPAQSALVATHGSQCGFCTPGIVMSLVGLYAEKVDPEPTKSTPTPAPETQETQETQETHEPISRREIEAALSGNLCRCTGYRPIIDAAKAMFDTERFPRPPAESPDVVRLWQPVPFSDVVTVPEPINAPETGAPAVKSPSAHQSVSKALSPEKLNPVMDTRQHLQSQSKQAWNPTDEQSLVQLLQAHPEAHLIAGGTDFALCVTQQYQSLEKIISLGAIDTLAQVVCDGATMRIGATATYTQLAPILAQYFPEFSAMLLRLGSQQIRNMGTVGGNIVNASPVGDTPPVLLALGATVELNGASGRRTLSLKDFFLDYKKTALEKGEYLRCIRVPVLKSDEVLKVYKISKRLEDDISTILFAIKLRVQKGKIVEVKTGFGGMAAFPKSGQHLEHMLRGKPLLENTFEDAKKSIALDFSPISDVRASADYRCNVAKGLILKCGLELLQDFGDNHADIKTCSAQMPSHRVMRVEQIHTACDFATLPADAGDGDV